MTKEPTNFFLKIIYNIWKKIDKDDVLREDEQLAFDIFKIALNDNDNIRVLNTEISGKKYIIPKTYYQDRDTSTCIILNSYANKITIVNHQYKYDVSIPIKTIGIMENMFNDKIQEERDAMEKEILKNNIESLSIVLQNFKNK